MPNESHRCRLCTTNDRAALAEELAERLWNSHSDRDIDPPWEKAGPYWQGNMRLVANETIKMLADG